MKYDLDRFVAAQEGDYAKALSEMQTGKKRTHWIWYIFPQLKGLGSSANAAYYGLDGIGEAEAYLRHPILGPRLIEISQALLAHAGKRPLDIMGSPDDLKLRSSMTLFSLVPDTDPVFSAVLQNLYDGEKDDRTVELLRPV